MLCTLSMEKFVTRVTSNRRLLMPCMMNKFHVPFAFLYYKKSFAEQQVTAMLVRRRALRGIMTGSQSPCPGALNV